MRPPQQAAPAAPAALASVIGIDDETCWSIDMQVSEKRLGSDSDEGQQAMDDIDAFERRLRGEAAPAAALKTAAGARVNKPKQQEQRKPASKSGASYVQAAHAAVKPAPVSEKEEAAVEGRRMVAELDDFDAGR